MSHSNHKPTRADTEATLIAIRKAVLMVLHDDLKNLDSGELEILQDTFENLNMLTERMSEPSPPASRF